MATVLDKLDEIAKGINSLPAAFISAMAKVPYASSATGRQPTPGGINRAGGATRLPMPKLPVPKDKAREWFGESGLGRAAAKTVNFASDFGEKFTKGLNYQTKNDKRRTAEEENLSRAGGLQSQGGGGGTDMSEMVKLLASIDKNIQNLPREIVSAMSRVPFGSPTNTQGGGKATQLGTGGGRQTQLAGGLKTTRQGSGNPSATMTVLGPAAGGGPTLKTLLGGGGGKTGIAGLAAALGIL